MDKETKALTDFYDNKIKDLEDKNKEKQDKLDKIEEYVRIFTDEEHEDITYDELLYILQIIKGEVK